MPHYATPIVQVRKRDGRIVPFEPERIALAAGKALTAAGTGNDKIARTICNDVLEELLARGYDSPEQIPDIATIQDLVENAFIKRGLSKAAKLYILYRAQHDKMRDHKQLMLDVQELVSNCIDREDWRVKENSSAG